MNNNNNNNDNFYLSDLINFNSRIKEMIKSSYKNQLDDEYCFLSFETLAEHLGYKKVVQCKNCIHRPITTDEYTVTIPWQGDQLDLTCPYVRLDDCIMPDDNFYCAFGEEK